MTHPLTLQILRNYYPRVHTLREYICCVTPGLDLAQQDDRASYVELLDTAFVAAPSESNPPRLVYVEPGCTFSELIDRVHAHLFRVGNGKSRNVLTLGYRIGDVRNEFGKADPFRAPVTNFFVNTTLRDLQNPDWQLLYQRAGESILFHLLTSTSVFVALPNECLVQVTGTVITDLKAKSTFVELPVKRPAAAPLTSCERESKRTRLDQQPGKSANKVHTAADVAFARSSMFYARPSIDRTNGRIAVGLPSHHVLNRLTKPNGRKEQTTTSPRDPTHDARHILKYIFPRQYGLNNVFVSENSYVVHDYTNREDEIEKLGPRRTPKRLDSVGPLAQDLLRRHAKCNYRAVRGRFCTSKIKQYSVSTDNTEAILEMMSETNIKTQASQPQTSFATTIANTTNTTVDITSSTTRSSSKPKPRFAEFACSHYEVYAFVKAATLLVIPRAFWGCPANLKLILKHVRTMIAARRFETLTLHTVLQGVRTEECEWLQQPSAQRANACEMRKRRELLEEFMYWYFDSFVRSLLKTNFYVTESSAYRNRVLYFRQDDWDALCAPLVDRLAKETFQQLDDKEVQSIVQERTLGFSFVRLLPKDTGVRPLVNLSHRGLPKGDSRWSQSINQILQATFQILTLEKNRQPTLLGASTFGVNDIYARLKAFQAEVIGADGKLPKLYFVKVDVKSCFDTIKQDKLLDILSDIISEDGYMIQKFGQINPTAGKMRRSIRKLACADGEHPHFLAFAADLAALLRHSIFVDHVIYSYEDRRDVLALLREHVTENIVKIGEKYYRQTIGIPQGSVLSTLLCSFFYGDLEKNALAFTREKGNLLLRYVDDYCYVTTDISNARRFLDVMNEGHPEYGAFIAPDKTLTNFDYGVDLLNRTPPLQKEFPWCGLVIDMHNLSIAVDYSRYKGQHVSNFITVDARRKPGKSFVHKMLRMAKHRTHVLYNDTSLSTPKTVYLNIYQNFVLTAMKMHLYLKDLRGGRAEHRFIFDAISQTIRFTQISMRHSMTHGLAKRCAASCRVPRSAVHWLGWHAFATVLERKQTAYTGVLALVRAQRDARHARPYGAQFKGVIARAWQDFADVIF